MTSLLLSWPGGSLESTLRLGAFVILSYTLVLWLSAVVWVYRDVRNRTTDPVSQVVAVLLVALFNLPGLIVYLVIRPQSTLADAYERSLEAEAILHELQLTANSCQNCRRPIDDDFNICPHCRTVLREACRACGRPIRTSWVACPFCANDRVPARPEGSTTTRRQPIRAPEPSATPAAVPPARPAISRDL
jgi:RNA polymerase subunit RPABC4/transcription elongation factor Spt4